MRLPGTALIALLALALPARAGDAGRLLYDGLAGAPGAALIGSNRVEASRFPCRGCHGRDGGGGTEGDAPAITWEALSRSTALRPAYDAEAFARALSEGRSPAGRALSRQMPRYDLDGETLAALIGYLSDLPRLQRRGILPDRIVLAVPVPPDAPETSRALAGALARAFDARLPPSGLHGRRIEIRAETDLARIGDEAATILGFRSTPGLPLDAVARLGTPLLFPLSPVSEDMDPTLVRSLLASREDAIRALARRAAGLPGPLAVLADDPAEMGIVAAELPDRDLHGVSRAADIPAGMGAVIALADAAETLLAAMGRMGADAVLLAELEAIAPHRAALEARNITGIGVYGGAVLLRARGAQDTPPLDVYADVAARIIVEAVAAAGRDLTQAALIDAIGQVNIPELSLNFASGRVSATGETILVPLTGGGR